MMAKNVPQTVSAVSSSAVANVVASVTTDGAPLPTEIPILPLRGVVIFPGAILPLTVHRLSSLKLLDDSMPQSKVLGVVTQRDEEVDHPTPDDLHTTGCGVTVLKLIPQGSKGVLLVVQATQRFAIRKFTQTEPFYRAEIAPLEQVQPPADDKQWQAEVRNLRDSAVQLLNMLPEVPEQITTVVGTLTDPILLTDFLAPNLELELAQKQALLDELDVAKRVRAIQTHIASRLEISEIQQKLQKDVASRFTDAQRRAYLREQMAAIREELGEEDPGEEEQEEQLRVRLEQAGLPTDIMAQAERELKRLAFIPSASPEHSVIVTYLETLADLPWQKLSDDVLDLDEAQRVLDRDHFGLEKVKRRLIEFLAVRKLNPNGHGPILCFLGPPGVGKTSLGQSIADALGRKFVRLSLGGLRDESEIRGHRRTYIGSMPGRLIQEIRRVGTRNPVMMLDELDKMGTDFRGDPASALLEVLDPRQNNTFMDRYLDVPFDLSKIIFIATANAIDPVPAPLRDRMEVIEIPGYTQREKSEIARRYLLERQLAENGIKPEQCVWQDGALEKIIQLYTHEAGVRNLEREIGAVCRSVAAKVARGKAERVEVTPDVIEEILGPPRYVPEDRLKVSLPGVVTGLAYTPYGGEILHIEAARFSGRGDLRLTGQLGDVMKESVAAAMSLVRTRAETLGIPAETFRRTDVHVHVPAGAVPKDGPSAGAAMFTALASLFTDTPVRANVAMTGEVTLRGLVLPIGGLKEKSLAAMRAGINVVIIPKGNIKDLVDVPAEAKDSMQFHPVETVDEVLQIALDIRPEPPERHG
ncbi:MAG TPA: endopeptidase La, partial [Chthoniobacterales bacterium]